MTSDRRPRDLPLAASFAALLFLAKAAFLLATPIRRLAMAPWLLDDSFIVMRVARNIALGHGFSFDGTHPTTGVSFLWTYLTALPHMLLPKDGAVYATLLLSAAFGALCTLAAFLIARHVSGRRDVAWTALLLSSLTAVPFFNAMNGMETSFFTLAVLLAIGAFIGVGRGAHASPWKWGVNVGLWTGIALMTRADAIFLLAALVLLYGVRWLRADKAGKRTLLKEAFAMGVTVAACLAVFLAWQMAQVGSPFPDNQIGRRGIALEKHNFDWAQFSLPRYIAITLWNVFQLETLVSLGAASSVLVTLALLLGLSAPRLRWLSIVTAVYAGVFFLALVAYQWYFPDVHGLRYLSPAFHLWAVLLAALFWSLPPGRWTPPAVGLLSLGMILLGWYRFAGYLRQPTWVAAGMHPFAQSSEADQAKFWRAIDWVSANVPADATIAVRDHGRMAFFTDRPVQDLAGILDPQVIPQWKAGTLGAYLKGRNVRYAFLPPPNPTKDSVYQAIHDQLPLTLLLEAPPQEQTGFRLYQVNNNGQ